MNNFSDSEFTSSFILKGNKVNLSLTSNTELSVEQCSGCGVSSPLSTRSKSETILIENIISIRSNNSKSDLGTITNSAHRILVEILVIDFVTKNKNHRWKRKSLCFRHTDPYIVSKWKEKLENLLQSVSVDRPKKLLIFVNPFGGKGKGPIIFHKKVAPLLKLSRIKYDLIETEYANHAKNLLQECSLEGIDGVISVGGDGIFSEIFTGMLLRAAKEFNGDFTQLRNGNIRVGVIPAGSSDAIALTHHGTRCPITATLHIILGDRLNVDVMRVTEIKNNEEKFAFFSLAMVSYGYVGDLLQSSESLRWLGPIRYEIAGVKTFINIKGYEGTITFSPSQENSVHAENLDNRCVYPCTTCKNVSQKLNNEDKESQDYAKSSKHGDKMEFDNEKETKILEGEFMTITGTVMSCISPKSPKGLSPSAHLGDGNLDLIVVNQTSRLNYLRYLIRTNMPSSNFSPFQLPFVQIYRVNEFSFQPENETTKKDFRGKSKSKPFKKRISVWNCDGELITNPSINAKVYCQILPVFARGIE